MKPITIPRNYRITIPREIREQFGLKPGQKIMYIPHDNILHVVIVPSIKQARRMLKGIDTNVEREEQDEGRD